MDIKAIASLGPAVARMAPIISSRHTDAAAGQAVWQDPPKSEGPPPTQQHVRAPSPQDPADATRKRLTQIFNEIYKETVKIQWEDEHKIDAWMNDTLPNTIMPELLAALNKNPKDLEKIVQIYASTPRGASHQALLTALGLPIAPVAQQTLPPANWRGALRLIQAIGPERIPLPMLANLLIEQDRYGEAGGLITADVPMVLQILSKANLAPGPQVSPEAIGVLNAVTGHLVWNGRADEVIPALNEHVFPQATWRGKTLRPVANALVAAAWLGRHQGAAPGKGILGIPSEAFWIDNLVLEPSGRPKSMTLHGPLGECIRIGWEENVLTLQSVGAKPPEPLTRGDSKQLRSWLRAVLAHRSQTGGGFAPLPIESLERLLESSKLPIPQQDIDVDYTDTVREKLRVHIRYVDKKEHVRAISNGPELVIGVYSYRGKVFQVAASRRFGRSKPIELNAQEKRLIDALNRKRQHDVFRAKPKGPPK